MPSAVRFRQLFVRIITRIPFLTYSRCLNSLLHRPIAVTRWSSLRLSFSSIRFLFLFLLPSHPNGAATLSPLPLSHVSHRCRCDLSFVWPRPLFLSPSPCSSAAFGPNLRLVHSPAPPSHLLAACPRHVGGDRRARPAQVRSRPARRQRSQSPIEATATAATERKSTRPPARADTSALRCPLLSLPVSRRTASCGRPSTSRPGRRWHSRSASC